MTIGTVVFGTERTVVWEDGGANPTSIPITVKLFFSNKVL
jgi:hypothetical protein